MTIIRRDRAELDRDDLDYCKEQLEQLIRRVHEPRLNLGELGSDFLEYAGLLTHFRPCTEDLSNALFSAAQAIKHHFLLSAQDANEGVVEVVVPYGGLNTELPDNTLRPTTGPTDFSDAMTWLNGFCLGLALREPTITESLLEYPTDRLRFARGVSVPEYVYGLVDLFKSLIRNDDSLTTALQAALAVCDPDNLPEKFTGLRPFALMAEAEMLVVGSLYAENQARFDEWVERALKTYRDFYRNYEGGLGNRMPRYFLYVRLLGLLAVAYDRGIRGNVQSDYVPQCIIENLYHP